MLAEVVTAALCEISCRMCSRYKQTGSAFAAILGDGSVVAWGDAEAGGDSSAVRDQLQNVQQIQAARFAFAAILGMAPW